MASTVASPAPIGTLNSPKKLKHKGSKPIITWITKRLGGSHNQRSTKPSTGQTNVAGDEFGARNDGPPRGRAVSLQVIPTSAPVASAVVLNDDHDLPSPSAARSMLSERNSMAADSTWTKKSPALEADDDASIRPLPPTSPPSPTLSHSSSSQISDLRTFRSGAASTKPTTVMSIDSGNGPGLITGTMAHIAQFTTPAPSSPTGTGGARFTAPLIHPAVARAASGHRSNIQAPLHTSHHPRNNPNPTSPPADNASTLTLASSAFAMSARANDWADGASMSLDQYQNDADVNSSHMGIEDEDAETAEASVRALRPRSSRRGSWESGESRWSARVGSGLPNMGSPSVISGMTRPSSIGGQSVARSLSINRLKMGPGLAEQEGRKVTAGAGDGVDGDRDRDRDNASNKQSSSLIEQSPQDREDVIPQPARTATPVAIRFSQATGE
jgi:hypothetical protein